MCMLVCMMRLQWERREASLTAGWMRAQKESRPKDNQMKQPKPRSRLPTDPNQVFAFQVCLLTLSCLPPHPRDTLSSFFSPTHFRHHCWDHCWAAIPGKRFHVGRTRCCDAATERGLMGDGVVVYTEAHIPSGHILRPRASAAWSVGMCACALALRRAGSIRCGQEFAVRRAPGRGGDGVRRRCVTTLMPLLASPKAASYISLPRLTLSCPKAIP